MDAADQERPVEQPSPPRRGFFAQTAAICLGALVGLVPLASGLRVLLDPLRRKRSVDFLQLTPLSAVPDDGLPHLYPVVFEHDDAWTKYPPAPIGAVYLIRPQGSKDLKAFTATCPHAGCFIGYTSGDTTFNCPCHTSKFTLTGQRVRGEAEVSPRDMDTLPVEIRHAPDGSDVVFVEFQRFQAGIHDKLPVA